MKTTDLSEIAGYGSRVHVEFVDEGKDSDMTKIEIDFSVSSFPEINIYGEEKKIAIYSYGAIERREILEAFRSVVKMLES